MRKVVFDIETKNIFQEVGSNNPTDLSISIVGIYDSQTDSFKTYLEDELPELWPILETTDLLIGFNSDHFDLPLLNKYYPGNLDKIKSLDILKEIQKSAGRRMKLDQVAEGTLGVNKSGHGLDAINWWKNGEIEKLRNYCLDDVRITRDLYNYAIQNQKLFFREGGRNNEIKLDTSNWEILPSGASVMNRTLPF
jgi:DEAD/DEAH box helicase domain-containing protein